MGIFTVYGEYGVFSQYLGHLTACVRQTKTPVYRQFVENQINYILGANPRKISYLIGFA